MEIEKAAEPEKEEIVKVEVPKVKPLEQPKEESVKVKEEKKPEKVVVDWNKSYEDMSVEELKAIGARKGTYKSLSVWAMICLLAMFIGPIGTAFLPKAVFGLFERFSTFSAVIFNAVLGTYLLLKKFEKNESI